ncbi:MAG TPA: YkgJ family cysteine cluster protein [Verrucomicrobiae bacterium]
MLPNQTIDQLCLQCGLCCNGVLFRDVELQPGDDVGKLKTLAMPVRGKAGKFNQPCVALGADCKCRIYADRPTRCRQFECALLLDVMAGHTDTEPALKLIRSTRRKADKVLKLMREIGDKNETVSLSVRFRKLRQRFESGDIEEWLEQKSEEELYDLFGQLTLAVHELNMVLAEKFYPQN